MGERVKANNMKITFASGYKYQLKKDYSVIIPLDIPVDVIMGYIEIRRTTEKNLVNLIVKKGYAWDGPSGPTIDTLNFMRGSVEHDALYQLIRMGLFPETFRKIADLRLKECCLEDGMSRLRAWIIYKGVRIMGAFATKAKNRRKWIVAP